MRRQVAPKVVGCRVCGRPFSAAAAASAEPVSFCSLACRKAAHACEERAKTIAALIERNRKREDRESHAGPAPWPREP